MFGIFKRPEQIERSPAEMEAADRLLTDCQRLPGLQFHRCRLPRGHTGTCHFEVIAGVEPTVRLPGPRDARAASSTGLDHRGQAA
jgi:hypothetical protein